MSILIKGMEMPTSCEDCIIDHKFFKWLGCNKLNLTECLNEGTRHKDCPLIPVPPHGRLIDADVLIKVLKTKAKNPLNQETTPYSWAFAYECLADAVGDMPTIIPAEEGEGWTT